MLKPRSSLDLTAKDVRAIRRAYAANRRLMDIAEEFGITEGNARYLATRHMWNHVYAGDDEDTAGRIHANSGENHGSAKLTEADVIKIREECKAGRNHADIAADYNLHRGSITRICSGSRWSSILGGERNTTPRRPPNAKLSDDQVREARRRRVDGESLASIAESLGVHLTTISAIVRRKRYRDVE